MYRIAKALDVLRNQFNKDYPDRSKVSDGWIGDTSHSARKSDHNPNAAGVVLAIDITHDPKHGVDTYAIAERMRANKDPRIDYVISNGRIFSSTKSPWVWRKYTGSNPHNKHVHVSVKKDAKHYDSIAPWNLGTVGSPIPDVPTVVENPLLRKGSESEAVKKLQSMLKITVDGIFGVNTEKAVKNFQQSRKLVADGIVGEYTWEALEKENK